MPSTRLIRQAHHNFKQNEIKWIPWKFRISVNKADEISAGRSSKVPKLEGLELHSLLMDDLPAMEISNASMGLNAVRSSMDIHNTALSLVGAAHLPQFAVAVKLEPETGLRPRPPTILEAQSVDKHLWSVVSDLVQEKSWSLDQALHELTYVRSDMSTWLQARPRLPKPSPPLKGGKGDRVPYQPWEPSGKFGKKGKSPKGGKGKSGTKWVTEALVDGKRHQLCMRYQTNQCTFADCKYLHACAMPTSEGAQKHPAISAGIHFTDSIRRRPPQSPQQM